MGQKPKDISRNYVNEYASQEFREKRDPFTLSSLSNKNFSIDEAHNERLDSVYTDDYSTKCKLFIYS